MKLEFVRLEGAGNSFLISFNSSIEKDILNKISMIDFVKKTCAETKSDGFILLEPARNENGLQSDQPIKEYKWFFYNRDGSMAEMCGNAARCVGHYLLSIKKLTQSNFLLRTIAGTILIEDLKKNETDQLGRTAYYYNVQMPPLKRLNHPQYFYCDSGVPHVVVPISNMARYPVMKNFCQEIREHVDFSPRGTNVTLIDTTNPEKIAAVTFERGVEDFTQACGTGAVAAAFYVWEKMGRAKSQIHMPGGRLDIDLENLTQPKMQGPVVLTQERIYDI